MGEPILTIFPKVTRSIVGFKKEESEALLQFLYNHISRGIDFQVRVGWAPKTVVVWDVSEFVYSERPKVLTDTA
jgi:sulfonate dioxygenase